MSLTRLSRPIVRRIGRLIVRIDADGVAIRGYRRRSWRRLDWARLAAAADDHGEIIAAGERIAGERILDAIGRPEASNGEA